MIYGRKGQLAELAPEFDVFAILFDTVPAFMLSTRPYYRNYPLCGAWHTMSKLIRDVIMIHKCHRGLPTATDRAVLLPLQELGQEKDHKYNQEREDMEKEIRREDSKVKRRTQDLERDQPTTNGMRQCKMKKTSEDRMSGHT